MALLTENFDSYNDGDLNGQGSWAGDASFDIQGVTIKAGTKAVKNADQGGAITIQKTGTATATGSLQIYIRCSDVTTNQLNVKLYKGNTGTATNRNLNIRWLATNIAYETGSAFTNFKTNAATNTWYLLQMEWQESDGKARYQIDAEGWTDWFAMQNTGYPAIVLLQAGIASGSGDYYFDEISPGAIVYTLTTSVGEFILTGVNTIFTKVLNLISSVATFALTGINTILTKGTNMACSVGEFTLTGIDTIFTKALNIVTAVGSFTLTGINVGFNKSLTMAVSVGQFILSGLGINFISWKYKTKNTTSYSNKAKNTSTYSNKSKNTSSWSYKTKK